MVERKRVTFKRTEYRPDYQIGKYSELLFLERLRNILQHPNTPEEIRDELLGDISFQNLFKKFPTKVR